MIHRACWSHALIALSGLLLLALAGTASATLVEATASSFTGDPLEVTLTIDDAQAPGDLVITLAVTGPGSAIGDLRGFFVQVTDESLLSGLTITGPSVTDTTFDANSVIDMGKGSNLNGGGSPCPCDLGVEFGSPGIGKDDLQTVTFTLSHATEALDASFLSGQSFGVRVTSVGEEDWRNGSSKLVGVVPEPGTALLVGLGLAGLAVARPGSRARRQRSS